MDASGSSQAQTILLPSRLRLDSRVLAAQASILWISNAIFCFFLLKKLEESVEWSWWTVFAPLLVSHVIHIPFTIAVMSAHQGAIERQLGPPPPAAASVSLHAQYAAMRSCRTRTHVIDHVSILVDSAAALIVKALFAHYLSEGKFGNICLRAVFTPVWVAWVVTTILRCCKHRTERVLGSQRDLAYIFLLFVAFKVDGQSTFSWSLVFLVPWIWLGAVVLLAIAVGCLLLYVKAWARPRQMLLPIGFFCLVLSSSVPHLISMAALCKYLESSGPSTSFQLILVPSAVGWACMWASTCLLSLGLHAKERVRAALLAAGAVWTANEGVARSLVDTADRAEMQRRIDAMTDDQVSDMVRTMMAARTPPTTLLRAGPTLFKVVSCDEQRSTDEPPSSSPTGCAPQTAATALGWQVQRSQGQQPGCESTLTPAGYPVAAAHTSVPTGSTVAPSTHPTHGLAVQEDEELDNSSSRSSLRPGLDLPPPTLTFRPLLSSSTDKGASSPMAASPGRSPLASFGMLGHVPSFQVRGTSGHAGQGAGEHGAATGADGGTMVQGLMDAELLGLGLAEEGRQPRQTTSSTTLQPESQSASTSARHTAVDVEVDDFTCMICYEEDVGHCVLLNCGHGGFCRRCAHLLFVRPPNECPTCRAGIDQVVMLELPVAPVGGEVKVKLSC